MEPPITTTNPDKLYQLPLREFLDILWGSRDKAHPELHHCVSIAALDKEEIYCHVEFPSESNDIKTPELWRIKAWKLSLERRKQEVEASNKRVLLWEMKKQLIDEVATGMILEMGLDEVMAQEKATNLVEKGKVGMCNHLGVDITKYLELVKGV